MIARLSVILLTVLSTGCGMARYDDISSQPEYVGLINTTYRSREVMLIHGVTLDANYAKVVDIYSLTPKPGMGGPEILSRDTLPVGTTIRVARVLGCTNCIFGGGDELEVELPTLTKYASHRTTIDFTFGGNDIVLKNGGKASLNSSLFEMIKR
jgi:hypothetical protein